MGLKDIHLSDIYFTPTGDTLLRNPFDIFHLNDVLDENNPALEELLNAEAPELEKSNAPNQQTQKIKPDNQLREQIKNDCAELLKRAQEQTEIDSAFTHDGFFYRANRSIAFSGKTYALRRLPLHVPEISKLGYHPELVKNIMELSQSQGLILLSGATGSGKTTTISSILHQFIQRDGDVAYTIEDPPEYQLHGLHNATGRKGYCVQTRPQNDSWAQSLRNALRSHPKYILVGEVRDPECASELLRASASGHLVFSTIHAQSVQDSISSLIKYASSVLSEDLAKNLLSQGLLCAIHQSLHFNILKYQFLFCGPPASAVRNKIAEAKFLTLLNDMQRQAIRLKSSQPLF